VSENVEDEDEDDVELFDKENVLGISSMIMLEALEENVEPIDSKSAIRFRVPSASFCFKQRIRDPDIQQSTNLDKRINKSVLLVVHRIRLQ
jgi:hypothetical protein